MRRIAIRTNKVTDEVRGLLFLAQCLDELLFDHTHDSYRSSALNTHLRVIELRVVAEQLEGTTFFSRTMPPFLEEFDWSVTNDRVLPQSSKTRLRATVVQIKAHLSQPAAVGPLIAGMRLEFDGYSNLLRTELRKSVLEQANEKKKILELAASFSVQVEVEGYSRRYAYFCVKRLIDRLIRDPHIDPGKLLDRFFRRLPSDVTERKYRVLLKGRTRFETYVDHARTFGFEVLSAAPELDKLNSDAIAWIQSKTADERFLFFSEVQETDPMNARGMVTRVLNEFRSSVVFVSHDEDLSFSQEAIVLDQNLGGSLLKGVPAPMLCGAKAGDQVHETINVVSEVMHDNHLDKTSSYRFRNALEYHAAALHSSQPENQLIDLWAALEGLLLTSENQAPRIVQISNAVVPSLVMRYVDELFDVLAREIGEDPKASSILEEQKIAGIPARQAAAFCVCDEFEGERIRLGSAIADSNPLLLYRIHALRERFRSRHRIRKTLIAHRTKLETHLNRIYFTRNSIVHSAESLPYLSMLVQHLHSYVDTTIQSIALVAVKSSTVTSIPQVTAFLSTHCEHHLVALNDKNEVDCNNANFVDLLVGESPISALNIIAAK